MKTLRPPGNRFVFRRKVRAWEGDRPKRICAAASGTRRRSVPRRLQQTARGRRARPPRYGCSSKCSHRRPGRRQPGWTIRSSRNVAARSIRRQTTPPPLRVTGEEPSTGMWRPASFNSRLARSTAGIRLRGAVDSLGTSKFQLPIRRLAGRRKLGRTARPSSAGSRKSLSPCVIHASANWANQAAPADTCA